MAQGYVLVLRPSEPGNKGMKNCYLSVAFLVPNSCLKWC